MTDRRRSLRGRRERPRRTPRTAAADAANGRGGLLLVLGGLLLVLGGLLLVLGGLLVVRGQPGIGKSALHPFRHATLDRGLLER
ncbi:hypothetical protein ACW69H_18070 [Streptomyces sp. SS10]